MHGSSSLPIGTIYGIAEDFHLLAQADKVTRGKDRKIFTQKLAKWTPHFTDLGMGNPVYDLAIDAIGERIIPCPKGVLMFPSRPHESIEWNSGQGTTGDLRVVIDRKARKTVEMHMDILTPSIGRPTR